MRAAFWSGFVSSGFSVGTKGYGGVSGRTLIMAAVGGTVSEITGGKFANGAVSGAFVHLFNAEGKNMWVKTHRYLKRVEEIAQRNKIEYYEAEGKIIRKAGGILSALVATGNANRIYNAQKWWPEKIYSGKGGAVLKILQGKPYPFTILVRTYPALMGEAAFNLGQEAGFYLPAYIEAWQE
ncbi:hypothetical protein [Hydrogenimonas sp.]